LAVLFSGPFLGAYLVHISNGFAGFIGHLIMVSLNDALQNAKLQDRTGSN
jgi:hypothetical protein